MGAMTEYHAERLGGSVQTRETPTLATRILRQGDFAAARVSDDRPGHGLTKPLPVEDAFVLSLQLKSTVHPCDLWVDGQPVPLRPGKSGSLLLFNLNQQSTADIRDPFDSVLFYFQRTALSGIADEHGAGTVRTLDIPPGVRVEDQVVRGLGMAVLPALERPHDANELFMEHVATALLVHLGQKYGGLSVRRPVPRGGLAPWQERRAKELLTARLGAVSLAELAGECGLSRSHFARAFKRTTGQPPYRWLTSHRVERAQSLLCEPNLPISEISGRLGFADESHFTRVFRHALGITPGAWRRATRR